MDKYKGHTPGPWEVDIEAGGDNFIKACADKSGYCVAVTMTRAGREANAKLIADAPLLAEQNAKMLAMLKRTPDGCYNDSPRFWGDLHDLIAEIEGDA